MIYGHILPITCVLDKYICLKSSTLQSKKISTMNNTDLQGTVQLKSPSRETLSEIAAKIVNYFHPEKIILFGSYAWGTPSSGSDVDILVVMDFEGSVFQKEAQVSRVARPKFVTMDILVRTPEQIRYRLEIGDPFIQKIMGEGEALYERGPC
jgi:predicted nucleotidyltransferase